MSTVIVSLSAATVVLIGAVILSRLALQFIAALIEGIHRLWRGRR